MATVTDIAQYEALLLVSLIVKVFSIDLLTIDPIWGIVIGIALHLLLERIKVGGWKA